MPPGTTYKVNGVKFDGFVNGTLIEAKSYFKKFVRDGRFRRWFRGTKSSVRQANRQLQAANGTPIEWRFAEAEVADATRELFLHNKIFGIRVVHIP
jgi:hypothetical protein